MKGATFYRVQNKSILQWLISHIKTLARDFIHAAREHVRIINILRDAAIDISSSRDRARTYVNEVCFAMFEFGTNINRF